MTWIVLVAGISVVVAMALCVILVINIGHS